jgi:hypothetical protein
VRIRTYTSCKLESPWKSPLGRLVSWFVVKSLNSKILSTRSSIFQRLNTYICCNFESPRKSPSGTLLSWVILRSLKKQKLALLSILKDKYVHLLQIFEPLKESFRNSFQLVTDKTSKQIRQEIERIGNSYRIVASAGIRDELRIQLGPVI